MMMKYFAALLLIISAVSVSWSLPAPTYLSVPHWESCVHTVTKGTAKFVCLPSKKPAHCPRPSWREFISQHLIENCPSGI
jgi:hypothetical protein